eukprot:528237_1
MNTSQFGLVTCVLTLFYGSIVSALHGHSSRLIHHEKYNAAHKAQKNMYNYFDYLWNYFYGDSRAQNDDLYYDYFDSDAGDEYYRGYDNDNADSLYNRLMNRYEIEEMQGKTKKKGKVKKGTVEAVPVKVAPVVVDPSACPYHGKTNTAAECCSDERCECDGVGKHHGISCDPLYNGYCVYGLKGKGDRIKRSKAKYYCNCRNK